MAPCQVQRKKAQPCQAYKQLLLVHSSTCAVFRPYKTRAKMVPALTTASPLQLVMSPCCMTSCVFFGKVKRCPPALECAAHILTTLCTASAETGLVNLSVHCICLICKGGAPVCTRQIAEYGSVSLPGKGETNGQG